MFACVEAVANGQSAIVMVRVGDGNGDGEHKLVVSILVIHGSHEVAVGVEADARAVGHTYHARKTAWLIAQHVWPHAERKVYAGVNLLGVVHQLLHVERPRKLEFQPGEVQVRAIFHMPIGVLQPIVGRNAPSGVAVVKPVPVLRAVRSAYVGIACLPTVAHACSHSPITIASAFYLYERVSPMLLVGRGRNEVDGSAKGACTEV